MRVLYFSESYSPHDYRFLETIVSGGYEVHYLRLRAEGITESRPLPDGVTSVGDLGNAPTLWHAIPKVRAVLKRLRPDIVHAGPIHLGALLVTVCSGRPLIAMSWGSDLLVDCTAGWNRFFARVTLRRCRLFICDADAVRDSAIQLGVDPRLVVQFPWGVDLDLFHPASTTSSPIPEWDRYRVILSTRNLEPLYDVETLVRAFAEVATDQPDLRLLILGDGSQQQTLKAIVDTAGLANRVRFLGHIQNSELPHYLRSADIYVTTSTSDGSSVSLLEAMATGLPVIVSDIPTNRQWVTSGRNGWLFPASDTDGLASVIREAASDSNDRISYGRANRSLAETSANWKRSADVLLSCYNTILNELANTTGRHQKSHDDPREPT